MRGHFAWQKGWGPQGQQEIWASDMFGFHPEADMHWSEAEGPEPLVGAAGVGKNTWFNGVIHYARVYTGEHSWLDSGGHRRLSEKQMPTSVRPVVPAALQWPAGLEPELLACGSEGMVAMARGGMGAYLPPSTEGGFGTVMPFTLEGLMKMGLAQSLSWGDEGLLAHTSSGAVVSCPMTAAGGTFHCSSVDLPPLPTYGKQMAVVLAATKEHPFRAAVVAEGKVRMHALKPLGLERDWHVMAELDLPLQSEVTSLTGDHQKIVVSMQDGSILLWSFTSHGPSSVLHEAPAAGPRRTWNSACAGFQGRIMRLASKWRKHPAGHTEWTPELLF